MSKIVFTKKRKETYVEIKLTSGQVLNNREYEILREGRYDYLLVPEAGKSLLNIMSMNTFRWKNILLQ